MLIRMTIMPSIASKFIHSEYEIYFIKYWLDKLRIFYNILLLHPICLLKILHFSFHSNIILPFINQNGENVKKLSILTEMFSNKESNDESIGYYPPYS